MSANVVPLGTIADAFVGYAPILVRSGSRTEPAFVLGVRALSDNGIDLGQAKRVELPPDIRDRYAVRAGDILVPARSTAWRAVEMPPCEETCVINATLIAIRVGTHLDARVLTAYLNHPEGAVAVDALTQSGTRQMSVTVKALKRVPVPVPSVDVQNRLRALLTASDEAWRSAIRSAQLRRELTAHAVVDVMFDRKDNTDNDDRDSDA
jgi:hypothetical protein